MMRARIIYFLVLSGIVSIAYVFNNQLSRELLLLVLLLPFVSLVLCIPAYFFVTISMACKEQKIERSSSVDIIAAVENHSLFLFPFIEFRLQSNPGIKLLVKNSIRISLGSKEKIRVAVPCETINRGLQSVKIVKMYAVDCMGIFRIPIRLRSGNKLSLLVLPKLPYKSDHTSCFLSAGSGDKNDLIGTSMNSDFQGELREFRPGDSIRGIHWKLYAKTGQFFVRNGSKPLAGEFSIALNPAINHFFIDAVRQKAAAEHRAELKELEDKLIETFLSAAGSLICKGNGAELWLYDKKAWNSFYASSLHDLAALQYTLAEYEFLYESSGVELEELLKKKVKGICILESDITGAIMFDGKAV